MNRWVDLWGRVVFHGDDAVELLMRGFDLRDLTITSNDAQYAMTCQQHNKTAYLIAPLISPDITPEDDATQRQQTWFLPAAYATLPVRERLLALCERPDELDRVNQELDLFEARDMLPVLRLMFFLVDHFRQNGIVWGVGRGSSVASYCLFLIGVHKIDALAYDLPIAEFLR